MLMKANNGIRLAKAKMLRVFDALLMDDPRLDDIVLVKTYGNYWTLGVYAKCRTTRSNVLCLESKLGSSVPHGHFMSFKQDTLEKHGIPVSSEGMKKRRKTSMRSLEENGQHEVLENAKLMVVEAWLEALDMHGELWVIVPCLGKALCEQEIVHVKSLEELLVTCDMQSCTSK